MPAFLFSPTFWLLCALGIASVTAGVQTIRVANCHEEVAEISAEYKILSSRVEEQNAKVAEFETAAKQAKERGRKAVQQAQGAIRAAESDRDRLASELQARAAKKSPGDVCADVRSAIAKVKEGLK